MTVVGDGEQRRDFTHVKDVVEANILAASTKDTEAFGQLFNVGTGTNHSVMELVKMFGGEFTHLPPRPAEARVSLADNSKGARLLNWIPKVELSTWIKEFMGG